MPGPGVDVYRNGKAQPCSYTATREARTHVRLGASHRGEPRLPGQHRGDVEVRDVHVPWRDKSTTQNVKSRSTPWRSRASYGEPLEAAFVNACVPVASAVQAAAAQLFCPQDQRHRQPAESAGKPAVQSQKVLSCLVKSSHSGNSAYDFSLATF